MGSGVLVEGTDRRAGSEFRQMGLTRELRSVFVVAVGGTSRLLSQKTAGLLDCL